MLFNYKALKRNQIVRGRVDASNETEAITYLKANDFFPIELKNAQVSNSLQLPKILNRVTFNDIVNLTRQLSIMLNAGLTLIDSFDILKKQVEKKPLLEMVTEINKGLRGGDSFSDNLKKYPNNFSSLYVALVKSGEASGKLSEVLMRLADDQEKAQAFISKIKAALVYPAIVIVGMMVVAFIMMTFVLPTLLNLFKDLSAEVPFQTQVLIFVSNFFASFWYLIIAGLIVGFLAIKKYLSTQKGSILFDIFVLKLPLVGTIIKKSTLVNATRTLSILISSGVSILESLNIIIGTTNNSVYRKAFKSIAVQVERGTSLGQAMINEEIFPPILVQMTLVGEQTGHLDETLIRVSNYFQLETEAAVKTLTTLIEPAILVVLGIAVAFMVSAIITPLYSIGDAIK